MDFRAPAAHVRFGGPRIASLACSRCSVPRVCQPSRRFSSSEPEPALFYAGSAHGTLRPFGAFSAGGWLRVSALAEPTYRFPFRLYHVARATRPAPEGRGFWVQTRASVLWPDGRTINSPPAGCSHGVLPLRAHQRMSCPGFRPVLLPRAFRCVAPENDANRRHLGVSIDTRLIATSLPDKPTLVATTLSGFCAACDQTCIQELSRPGLFFRLTAFGCITAAVRRS